jgi:hypothetical protein
LIWIKKASQGLEILWYKAKLLYTRYLPIRTLTIKYPALLEIVPIIAWRVIVIGEERKILADGSPESILSNRDLLVQANLIHPQLHAYGYLRNSSGVESGL